MKSNPEYDEFNAAMDTILKADPANVKAQMEAEKKEREAKRTGKRQSDRGKKGESAKEGPK